MAPAIKAKRLPKPVKRKSSPVAQSKPKWEKKKSISAQPGVTKIKNVNKRSFDPIKANRGVVLLKNIPHGFYEQQMRDYFSQFGLVTRVRLARSQRTGRSKGFAYIEFKVPEVAEIAAETMNNYIMFQHVLKTVYIPPEKQTYNFFRKDVSFITDSEGQTSFTSDKIKNIENEIEKINRVPTDEEHAARLKRSEKTLQKQQKKYGIDLSSIMVSNNNSSAKASASEVKPTETKKKAKAIKKVDEIQVVKQQSDKIATKKDKKKVNDKAKSNDGKSLLAELVNTTYETDTSDDDFKIDHSFSGSVDDSDESSSGDGNSSFADLLAKKWKTMSTCKETSGDISESDDDPESDDDDAESDDDNAESDDDNAESDDDNAESDDDSDDGAGFFDESASEDDEPEIVPQKPKATKKFSKELATNGDTNAISIKPKTGDKRKHKESSQLSNQSASSSQSELVKKKKPNQNKKAPTSPSTSEISASDPETPKIVKLNKKQKKHQAVASTTTSSLEQERVPAKQKKSKQASGVKSATNLASKAVNVLATVTGKETNKKKKTKQASSSNWAVDSSISETMSSEPDTKKIKMRPKKIGQNSNVAAPKSEPVNVNVKLTKKKNQPAKDEEINPTATSPQILPQLDSQNSKKIKKPKPAIVEEIFTSKPSAPIVMDKKAKKLKPVTSSLISVNGLAKKSKKSNANVTDKSASSQHESAWTTASDTDGEALKKPKKLGKTDLRTIAQKTISKKKIGSAKPLDIKKVKQTPDELLQLLSSKELKQNNQLKSKKKSKK